MDLTSPDPVASKSFYTELLGWEADDRPMGDGAVYSMMMIGSKMVCAISPQNDNQRAAGMAPTWNSYVCVADADSVAERAQELGAEVPAGPFDVFEAGRMAMLADLQGAIFFIWQPRQHQGAQLVNAPGALCWNELYTPDMDRASSFYGDLFGWTAAPFEESPMPYLVISNNGRANGGITTTQDGMDPAWLAYFAVEDIDAGLARVAELGGETVVGPIDIGVAKIGIVHDPQGAGFALYAGRLDD